MSYPRLAAAAKMWILARLRFLLRLSAILEKHSHKSWVLHEGRDHHFAVGREGDFLLLWVHKVVQGAGGGSWIGLFLSKCFNRQGSVFCWKLIVACYPCLSICSKIMRKTAFWKCIVLPKVLCPWCYAVPVSIQRWPQRPRRHQHTKRPRSRYTGLQRI